MKTGEPNTPTPNTKHECRCGEQMMAQGHVLTLPDGWTHSWSRCASDRQTWILLGGDAEDCLVPAAESPRGNDLQSTKEEAHGKP